MATRPCPHCGHDVDVYPWLVEYARSDQGRERSRQLGRAQRTHGGSDRGGPLHGTYRSWQAMKRRCDNPKSSDYSRYGGRGITYDPRWQVFETFLADMGPRPDGASIDRIDNDGPYSLTNCRWATASEQRRNHPQPRGWKRHDAKPRVYGMKSLLCAGGCGLAVEVKSMVAKVYCPKCKRLVMREAQAAWAAKPKPPCAVDGCDRPSHARGWCKSHYLRWHLKGDTGPATFREYVNRP